MKKLLWFVLICVVAGGGIGYYLWNKAPESVGKKTPDFTLMPKELLVDYDDNEEAANAKYLGKIIEVKGVIEEIIPGDKLQMQIVLETGDMMSRISCVMEEDYKTFLARKLQKGDTVTIKGICTGRIMDIVLDRCVIVS